ncbi:hypothetical protein [Lactobacillus sp. UCMA15818]|uniref:hypothetical protein n=1 Tax=Lactobacillus sp. UCMA15818 TaxID=2583394 RepID=UPI0025AFD4E4|nr:hypothetical protein [Lactobacillus sp. UCMA15818]MDN2452538.1 hypothetical protein [Lactobacillus sp. UCMA15818]
MRYEKGDKVKIAKVPNERMANGMYKYCGWRVTIAGSRKYVGSHDIVYHIKEDKGKYAWFEDDFEKEERG